MIKKTLNHSDPKELVLAVIGSSWWYDSLYLFIITPMGLIGFILNTLSLIVFFNKRFRHINLFKYFKIYTFNYLIVSLMVSCFFFLSPKYFFKLSISYSARIFKCLVVPSYGIALLFFYGNAMGILLNLERASNYSIRYRRFKQINPYKLSFILFLICVVINIPSCFLVKIASDKDVEDAINNYENAIKFKGICIRHPISLTLYGKIATIFGYSVKGLLTLILDIASNIASMLAYKTFIQSKLKSLNLESNKKTDILNQFAIKSKKHTFMTFYLTLFSICVHIIQFSADMSIFIFGLGPSYKFAFTFLIMFVCAVKLIVNVLFFYLFNKNFRKSFNILLKIK